MADGSYAGRARRAAGKLSAAQRASAKGPAKGTGGQLTPTGPGKQSPGGAPAKGYGAPLGSTPQVTSQTAQPTTSPGPANVLGARPGVAGDSYVPGTQLNTQSAPTGGLSGARPGAARAGKRFTVGFTRDGRIVHLYGGDVPADQRRVVLSKQR